MGERRDKAWERLTKFEDVRPWTETRVHLQHDGFAKRIDRRIGDLRESLAEKGVERARRAG